MLTIVLYTLWSMVSYIKGGSHANGIWKQNSEVNIWSQDGYIWGLEKASQWGTSYFVPFIKYSQGD